MNDWPVEWIRFTEREAPVFLHLACAKPGETPYSCRGYGCRLDPERTQLTVYILKSQWPRLQEALGPGRQLAVLMTSGTDNESYQVKGIYRSAGILSGEDEAALVRLHGWIERHTPSLAPLIRVRPADCLAVALDIRALYVQTPGPRAGSALWEGGEPL